MEDQQFPLAAFIGPRSPWKSQCKICCLAFHVSSVCYVSPSTIMIYYTPLQAGATIMIDAAASSTVLKSCHGYTNAVGFYVEQPFGTIALRSVLLGTWYLITVCVVAAPCCRSPA